jgi:hypothetical protein
MGPYTAVEIAALQRWVEPGRHGRAFGLQRSIVVTATPVGADVGVKRDRSL